MEMSLSEIESPFGGETLFARIITAKSVEEYRDYKRTGLPARLLGRIQKIENRLRGVTDKGNPCRRYFPDANFNFTVNMLMELGCTNRKIANAVGLKEQQFSHALRGRRDIDNACVVACLNYLETRLEEMVHSALKQFPRPLRLISTSHTIGSNISTNETKDEVSKATMSRLFDGYFGRPLNPLPGNIPGAVLEITSGVWLVTGNTDSYSAHEWRALGRLCEAMAMSLEASVKLGSRSSDELLYTEIQRHRNNGDSYD